MQRRGRNPGVAGQGSAEEAAALVQDASGALSALMQRAQQRALAGATDAMTGCSALMQALTWPGGDSCPLAEGVHTALTAEAKGFLSDG